MYALAKSQVSYNERTKTTMVTKNWTYKVRLSSFPNNLYEAFLLTIKKNAKIFDALFLIGPLIESPKVDEHLNQDRS